MLYCRLPANKPAQSFCLVRNQTERFIPPIPILQPLHLPHIHDEIQMRAGIAIVGFSGWVFEITVDEGKVCGEQYSGGIVEVLIGAVDAGASDFAVANGQVGDAALLYALKAGFLQFADQPVGDAVKVFAVVLDAIDWQSYRHHQVARIDDHCAASPIAAQDRHTVACDSIQMQFDVGFASAANNDCRQRRAIDLQARLAGSQNLLDQVVVVVVASDCECAAGFSHDDR